IDAISPAAPAPTTAMSTGSCSIVWAKPAARSADAPVDADEVIAELGLHGLGDLPDGEVAEDDAVELGDHVAAPELAQRAALAPGGAGGVLLREVAEVGVLLLDLALEVQRFGFGLDENVARGGSCHGWLSLISVFAAALRGGAGSYAPAPRERRSLPGEEPAEDLGRGERVELGAGFALELVEVADARVRDELDGVDGADAPQRKGAAARDGDDPAPFLAAPVGGLAARGGGIVPVDLGEFRVDHQPVLGRGAVVEEAADEDAAVADDEVDEKLARGVEGRLDLAQGA